MSNPGRRAPRFLQPIGGPLVRVAGLALATLLAQSFCWSPDNPAALKAAVAGVALLAAFRPDLALLALAAVVPFGRVISTLLSPGAPVGITEALALAYLAGWAVSRLRGAAHDGPASPGLLLGCGFAAIVVASLLVDIGILRYWKDYWQPFLGQLLAYFGRDYLNIDVETRPWASGLGGLASATTAARFLEGLGLMRAAQTLCARNAAFGRQLLWTLAIAAAGTAILSVEAALQLPGASWRDLVFVSQTNRITAHVAKINTAASYFVLFIPVLIGVGIRPAQSRPRAAWIRALRLTVTAAGLALLSMALWLTGTRSAMAAGGIVAAGASARALTRGRLGHGTRRAALAVVAACGIVCALLVYGFYLRTAALETAKATHGSLPVRVLMWQGALKTLAARPVFGVGIGQFRYEVATFDPDAVLPENIGLSRFNAHNQFLEMAAEVGVIGGLLFVGMFAVILRRAWAAFRTSRDPALGGVIAGVAAFLITCLTGQPLLHEVVAFPFWMVLGVALAAGDGAPAAIVAGQTAGGNRRSRLAAGFLIIVALSVPVRVWHGKDEVNFALARYGFSGWHHPSYGRPYRLVRGEATFFTYPQVRSVKLPIRRDVEAGRNPLDVEISLDGRRARTLTLADDEWQTVELAIPADATRRFRRVDLAIRAPADVTGQVRVAAPEISNDQTVDQDRSR